jgi:hypothetical protein
VAKGVIQQGVTRRCSPRREVHLASHEALKRRVPTPPQCQKILQHEELVLKGDKSKLICFVTSSLSWIELKEGSVLQFH